MNIGVVASRYAKALLKFVQENGTGEVVYSQVLTLVHAFENLPKFKDIVENHDDVTIDRKCQLMSSACEGGLHDDMDRFIRLVASHGRLELTERILQSFISLYRAANRIKVGKLVTVASDAHLKGRLEELLRNKTGASVILEETVDPEILGGFIFEIDDLRLDASVRTGLDRIRRELVENNNRIV